MRFGTHPDGKTVSHRGLAPSHVSSSRYPDGTGALAILYLLMGQQGLLYHKSKILRSDKKDSDFTEREGRHGLVRKDWINNWEFDAALPFCA